MIPVEFFQSIFRFQLTQAERLPEKIDIKRMASALHHLSLVETPQCVVRYCLRWLDKLLINNGHMKGLWLFGYCPLWLVPDGYLTKTPEVWDSKLFLCSCHCVCWHLYSKLLAVLCTFCWWLSMILDGVMWDFMARKSTLQTWTSWRRKESFWITTMYNRFVLRLEVLFSPADIQYTQVCCQPFFQHRAPNFYWINV